MKQELNELNMMKELCYKTGHVLRCNGYDQAARLAEMLYEETKE